MGQSHGDPGGWISCPTHGPQGTTKEECSRCADSRLDVIQGVVDDIHGFDVFCQSTEYTDTEQLWELLHGIVNRLLVTFNLPDPRTGGAE